jgi:hypothetical protein
MAHNEDELKSWNGHNKLRASLLKAGFTTSTEVLACPAHALQQRAKLSASDAELCKKLLSTWRLPETQTVAQLLEDQLPPELLQIGAEAIDRILMGGLRPGTVTEIYGEA